MKNSIKWMAGVLLVLLLAGCHHEQPKEMNKLNIVTSFYPMYIATSNIVDGVEGVQLVNMTKTDVGCLHDYLLTTKDMNVLEKADVFVINGGGMESFLDKAMNSYPALKIINASEGILEEHETLEHDSNDLDLAEHHHEENAHIWVSISMYIKQVENIATELGKIDEIHQEQYTKNAEEYIQRLEQLKSEMHNQLDNLEHKNIVTFHEAFEFFAEEYHLNVVAVIEREPGTSPSAGALAQMIETIKQTNATAIFIEPQYDTSVANVIAKETNIPVYQLDPIVTGELKKDAYEETMKRNLEVLKEALK